MEIGKKLRSLRLQKGLTLLELSKRSGVQLATLSRMENLKMTGTLESHMNIAKVLGLSLPQLYSDIELEQKDTSAKHPEPKTEIFRHNESAAYEILASNILLKKMMPVLLKIEPQGKTNKEQNTAGSEKFIFVLEGNLEAQIGKDAYTLSKYNTLYFDASLPHVFINKGKAVAKAVCVSTPVTL